MRGQQHYITRSVLFSSLLLTIHTFTFLGRRKRVYNAGPESGGKGKMGTAPQQVPSLPSPSRLLPILHFSVGLAALIVAIIGLLTRPEVQKILSDLIKGAGGAISGGPIAPPAFDPTLARILHG